MTIIPDCNDSKKMVFAKTHSQNIKSKGRQNGWAERNGGNITVNITGLLLYAVCLVLEKVDTV